MTAQLVEAVNGAFDEFEVCFEHQKDMARRSIEALLLFYDIKPAVYDKILAEIQDVSLEKLNEILSIVESMLESAVPA
jgi:hypothetical protein